MFLTHIDYWFYLAFVLTCFVLVKDHLKFKVAYLVLVSLVYYYICSGAYLLLLVISIFWCYLAVQLMNRAKSDTVRKIILLIGSFTVAFCLGYYNWSKLIIEILNAAFGLHLDLSDYIVDSLTKVRVDPDGIKRIVTPLGLSFFALHEISHMVDIYRKKVPADNSILDFSLYIAFFPQLVSGPIIRAQYFYPQLKNLGINRDMAWQAILLILFGLIKKICFADYLFANLMRPVFDNPSAYSLSVTWLAFLSHAVGFYCDLSGYTDIALGTALLFGIRLPENFNFPYKAHNMEEFWRRWHISIYAWLRDYIYFPLGGSRNGPVRTYINLAITFFLCAIWHGATLHVLMWGAMNYISLILTRIWSNLNLLGNRLLNLRHNLGVVSTNLIFMTTGLWFSANYTNATELFKKIYFISPQPWEMQHILNYKLCIFLSIVGTFGHFMGSSLRIQLKEFLFSATTGYRVLIVAVALVLLKFFSQGGTSEFIYSQF